MNDWQRQSLSSVAGTYSLGTNKRGMTNGSEFKIVNIKRVPHTDIMSAGSMFEVMARMSGSVTVLRIQLSRWRHFPPQWSTTMDMWSSTALMTRRRERRRDWNWHVVCWRSCSKLYLINHFGNGTLSKSTQDGFQNDMTMNLPSTNINF